LFGVAYTNESKEQEDAPRDPNKKEPSVVRGAAKLAVLGVILAAIASGRK